MCSEVEVDDVDLEANDVNEGDVLLVFALEDEVSETGVNDEEDGIAFRLVDVPPVVVL
jgi:hypothetical protein